jgi:4-amino-4-deoxy-L-arabinose transferase-like glycosyltransferase
LLLAAPGCFWLLLAASGCFWLLLAASGCSWLLLAAPGCSWLLLAASGCSWLLPAPEPSQNRPQELHFKGFWAQPRNLARIGLRSFSFSDFGQLHFRFDLLLKFVLNNY